MYLDRQEKTWIVVCTTVLVILITYLVIAMNNWEDRCNDIGGVVESRYMYTQMTTINNVTTYTDIYSYHCMVNGSEVEI